MQLVINGLVTNEWYCCSMSTGTGLHINWNIVPSNKESRSI